MAMQDLRRLALRLRNVARPHHQDADVAREMSAHLALLEDEYVRRGIPPEEARRLARLTFGGVEQAKELQRAARSLPWLEDTLRDVRYAFRLLRRTPVFAVTAIASLAIAIGATTTVFTAVNALLVRTAPGVAEPDRLVDISRMTGDVGLEAISRDQYLTIRDRVSSVEQVYAYALVLTPMAWSPDTGEGGQAVFADVVTPNFFTALGVTPAAGRMFADGETGPVVVLSHRFWRDRYQGSPDVIGTGMRLGETTFTIVGVAAREFHGNTILAPDLWLPSDGRRPLEIGLVGARLKAGVSLSEARAEIESIGRELPAGSGRAQQMFATLRLSRSSPVPYGVRLIVGGFLGLLMAIVSLVLIVACTNVAGLLLARAAGRARETAVRVALGISRTRLVRQLLTETVLLFTVGGIAGLLLSRAMNAAILRLVPALPLPADPSLVQDGRVVGFALGVSFVSAIVFGLAPAVRTARVDVLSLLKTQEQGGASTLRLRRAFVVAQVALSVVLVVVGGLLTRALGRSASVDRGFDARGVDVISIDLGTAGYTAASGRAFIGELERRLQSLPDGESTAIAALTPNTGAMGFQIGVPGVRPPDGRPLFEVVGNAVTRGYFATLRIPLLAGRDFGDRDSDTPTHAVILSEAAARRFWPALAPRDAVGRELLLHPFVVEGGIRGGAATAVPITVVGIVADVRGGPIARPFIYLPLQQQYTAAINILVRARGEGRGIPRVRGVLMAMDRRLPVLAAGGLENQASPVTLQLRISAAIAGSLGALGVLLAAIGIYGVTSHMVARRTREIGIRVALGADNAAVVRMALGEAVRLLGAGAAAGVLLAGLAAQVLRGLQFGVEAADPLAYAVTIALFTVVGLAASYVPVRRALAIDPCRALRSE
jgi:putative ABC transport system permease protein